MKILVTGSAGHLGEALMRTLPAAGHQAIGLDIKASPFTDCVGSLVDREFVRESSAQAEAILHTATLHKPHLGTHSRQAFIDTNISGTLNLLEAAIEYGCRSFVFTSTTSAFGATLKPAPGEPAVWVTESLQPIPKNIYGVSKTAAEELCHLFHRNTGLPCVILRTSRFFPEPDDDSSQRNAFDDDNLKVNELLYRRADIADIVDIHLLAMNKASEIGFDRFIISATTPFRPEDAAELGVDAPTVVARYVPAYQELYTARNWRMLPSIGRVYDNARARRMLGWQPRYDFESVIQRLLDGQDHRSELARTIGAKGYHENDFDDGPYPLGSF